MSDKHPYVTAPGHVPQVLNQFRKTFPTKVDADTLRKLGLAPKNESYIINLLRFLGLIDSDGNKTDLALQVFTQHDDNLFQKEFSKVIRESYKDLFELHGENAWELDRDSLITFFRSADGTSERVGKLQASTFQRLSSLAGYGEPAVQSKTRKASRRTSADAKTRAVKKAPSEQTPTSRVQGIGLTVRIEINLPADGDQETYNRIFKSIREYLLNG